MTDIVTGRMTPVGLEACVAYGAAALAVMEVKHAAATADVTQGAAAGAFEDLVRAHDELSQLFANGEARSVPALALSVIVLAERVTTLLER